MAPVIRVDDEVFEKLRERAMQDSDLVWQPQNATLRKILGLPPTRGSHFHTALPDISTQPGLHGSEWCAGRPLGGKRPRRFVEAAKERYEAGRVDAEGFIGEIWMGIKQSVQKRGKNEHIVERATRALLKLSQEAGRRPVLGRDILRTADIAPNQTSSYGLWVWLGAGVVQEVRDERGRRAYTIPDDAQYAALIKVVPLTD